MSSSQSGTDAAEDAAHCAALVVFGFSGDLGRKKVWGPAEADALIAADGAWYNRE